MFPGLRRWLMGCGAVVLSAVLEVVAVAAPFGDGVEAEVGGASAWRGAAAAGALRLGFAGEASALYTELLASGGVGPGERAEALLGLASARLASGDVEGAAAALADYEGPRSGAYLVRLALVAYSKRDLIAAAAAVAEAASAELESEDRAWLPFLRGLLADASGDFAAAQAAYEEAGPLAASAAQATQFTLARLRARMLSGEVTDELAAQLERSVQDFQGRRVGHQFAQQLAVVLEQLGRREEALALLERQLRSLPPEEVEARDGFLLFTGLISGGGTEGGRRAFGELLSRGTRRDWQQVALQQLGAGAEAPGAGAALRALLDELLGRDPPHPLREELLLARARVVYGRGRLSDAEADLTLLLSQYPGSAFRRPVLALLASMAWQDRRFLQAAGWTSQLRDEVPAGEERANLAVLLADCYLQAEDWGNAADAYAAAAAQAPSGVAAGALLERRVACEIRAGRLDRAREAIDAAGSQVGIGSRWEAEWTYLRSLQDANRGGEAFSRLEQQLSLGPRPEVPAELWLRLAWLRAQLALDAGFPGEVSARVAEVRAQLAVATGLDPGLADALASSAGLLEAEAQLVQSDVAGGRATLERLRVEFPGSEAAIQSYLVEARQLSGAGSLVPAEALLIRLADEHPNSAQAPVALYEAGIAAARQEVAARLDQAIERFERLATGYPGHALVFRARLQQGDLLRRLNRFEAAQQVYEALVNGHRGHPDVHLAEVALADALLAQSTTDSGRFDTAAGLLERVFDLPAAPADLRVEAGCKLAYAYAVRTRPQRAAEVYLGVISLFAEAPEAAARLGPTGRYWLGRALLELGELKEVQAKTDGTRLEEARRAYDLLVKMGLPGATIARQRLQRIGGAG